ncbi:NAD(P)H-binding protein [Streptomyces sp. NBC_00009]|uniref:NAD(P)H-binding protein n=1 Tax=Streptomyces sp. NBC_00009 TaxID=2975620 RepID=UPI00324992CA
MILITGATGTIGSEVVKRMSPAWPLRLMTRSPERVQAIGLSSEVIRGDYHDRSSLDVAVKGVDAALLITNNPLRDDDSAFLRACRNGGIRHVVKMSAAAVEDEQAHDLIRRWQRRNESLLRDSGLSWTLLRPRAFMSNTLSWSHSVRSEGVVRALFGTAPNACIDPGDVAAVAMHALTEPGHNGATYTLTGPQALSAQRQTEELSRVLARPVTFEELTVAQARSQWSSRYPEPVVDALLDSALRQQDGAKTQVTSTVRDVTGRAANTFAAWCGEHRHTFSETR